MATKKPKKKSPYYIDKAEFYQAMVDFKAKVNAAKEKGEQRPKIPDYIGKCFWLIATGIGSKPCYASYVFHSELISDAIENCVLYIDNFNPEKSTNPFGYFTQVIIFAFWRRIEREKKELYIKYKLMVSRGYDQYTEEDGDIQYTMNSDKLNEIAADFEAGLAAKKTKRKAMQLEKQAREQQAD